MPRIDPSARRALVAERKAQILAAAAKVFARKGFERATIAEIAKAAGVAEGSIYNYFKNKSDLLVNIPRGVVQPAVESMHLDMTALAAGDEPPPDVVLATIARTLIATVRQNAHIFRILLTALPTLKLSSRQQYMEQVIVYATGVLEGYFKQQIARGVFRPDLNPTIATRIFIGMFFPFVMLSAVLQVEEPTAFDDDEVIAAAISLYLNGVLAAPKPARAKRTT